MEIDDITEQIIIRLDVKDIIRCKSVCKSWQSLISSPRFVKYHLDHSYKKDGKTNGTGHRRIVMARFTLGAFKRGCVREVDDSTFDLHKCHLAGSSNGLVCICPTGFWVLVANPSTREVRNLTAPPCSTYLRASICWGFGYDPATDDYKVIRTFRLDEDALQCFLVLTLKSNAWKFVAHLRYTFISRIGTLGNGALHWLVKDRQNNSKKLILSFCLSQEIFKEMLQPDDASYVFMHDTRLGIFEGCLCVFRLGYHHRWVMRSYNVAQSWEKLPHNQKMQPVSAHYLKSFDDFNPASRSYFPNYFHSSDEYMAPQKDFCHGIDLSTNCWKYVYAPIFVQSLVSPHVKHGSLKRKMLENIGNRNHKLLKEDAYVTL